MVRGLLAAIGLFLLIVQVAAVSRGPSSPPVVDRLMAITAVGR